VLTGEIRGIVDDVVTIAVDAGDTPKVDPSREYRLVTLPVEDRPDREFASLLRTAAETFSTVTVEAGSPLHGLPVGSLDLTVTVIRPDNDEPVPFPDGTYRLLPGDLLFVITPASELRRLEAASEPLDPSIASDRGTVSTDSVLPDERSQTVDQTATTGDNPSSEDEVPAIDQPATQDEWAETERPTGQADPVESAVEEKATADSFKEMKAEFDGTDAADEQERDKAQDNEDDTESSTTSFGELKAEFDAGEADWDEPQTEREQDPKQQESEQQESPADNENDELVRLEEAEITFDDEETDSETDSAATSEADNSVQEESASDDLESLEFDDDAEETGNLDLDATDELFSEIGDESVDDTETAVTGEETDTGDGNGRGEPPGEGEETEEKAMAGEDEANDADSDDDETNNDEDDDEESSGGKSFAELKDEFESGEADWEEDVSDSPGGDMRLDE
jgi:hypothetical protein